MSWRPTRLRYLAAVPISNGLGLPGAAGEAGWPRYIRTTDIAGPRQLRDDTRASQPPDVAAQALVERGDLLFCCAGSLGVTYLHLSDEQACYAGYLARVRFRIWVDPRFASYWAESSLCREQIEMGAVRSTIDNFSARKVANLALLIPDTAIQHGIADFLDRECERIEVLRASVSRLRAQREELVGAVIREEVGGCAVAGRRRLPDFDWLPGLPVSWPVLQIRRVARTGTGHTPSRTHQEYWIADECTIPWFTLADVWQIRSDEVELVTETAEKISQAGVDNSSAEVHPRGTVLLSRTASVGFSAVMGREMAVSQDFMTWTCGDLLDPYFLLYALRAMRPELYRLTAGSTHKTIYMPDLHALRIPLPEIDDQVRIVARIRERVGSVTQLGELDDRLDARLTEYRDALITEAVTGQLDVTRLSDVQLDESAQAVLEGETPEVLAS